MRLLSFTIIILLVSCSPNKLSTSTRTMEFKTKDCGFSIDAPTNWEYKEQQGMDSYIGEIYIGNKDTIHFDLGYFSSSLDHALCTLELDIDDDLVKTKTDAEIVNGLNAKFVLHKYKKLNDFGIYFDSIWTIKHGNGDQLDSRDNVRFTVYGINISTTTQIQMRQVFRTIKFFKYN